MCSFIRNFVFLYVFYLAFLEFQVCKFNIIIYRKAFRKLVKEHFLRGHKLYKIFNRNTLKLSYSCMSSMSSVIKQHNYSVLSTIENVDRLCNCRNKENCPLDGKCLQTCIVYKADVITNKDSHIYYGASDGEFKSRYNNHTNSFRHRHHEQDTELSKHIWKLQDKGINFKVKWSVAAYASTYRCGLRRCDLSFTEKYIIARANRKNLLNKRSEIISKFRHENKCLFKKYQITVKSIKELRSNLS